MHALLHEAGPWLEHYGEHHAAQLRALWRHINPYAAAASILALLALALWLLRHRWQDGARADTPRQ